jgi:hypothetical protein
VPKFAITILPSPSMLMPFGSPPARPDAPQAAVGADLGARAVLVGRPDHAVGGNDHVFGAREP